MGKLELYAIKLSENLNIQLEEHPRKNELGANVWQIGKNNEITIQYWMQDNKKTVYEKVILQKKEDYWCIETDKENNKNFLLRHEIKNENLQQKAQRLTKIHESNNILTEKIYDAFMSLYSADVTNPEIKTGRNNSLILTKTIKEKEIDSLAEYFEKLL